MCVDNVCWGHKTLAMFTNIGSIQYVDACVHVHVHVCLSEFGLCNYCGHHTHTYYMAEVCMEHLPSHTHSKHTPLGIPHQYSHVRLVYSNIHKRKISIFGLPGDSKIELYGHDETQYAGQPINT